ncbi:hypothetical protein BH11ARM2_BH11ARM2_18160 [soil metagenome]
MRAMRRLFFPALLLLAAGCGTMNEDSGRPDYMPVPGRAAPDEPPTEEAMKSGAQKDPRGHEVHEGAEAH